jgi:hypothetical protein
MKKLFLCMLFVGLIIGFHSPSFAWRNNCDEIMSDIMAKEREKMQLQQFLDESRPGTPTHKKMVMELRRNSGEKYRLEKEYQQCMEWRKKQQ